MIGIIATALNTYHAKTLSKHLEKLTKKQTQGLSGNNRNIIEASLMDDPLSEKLSSTLDKLTNFLSDSDSSSSKNKQKEIKSNNMFRNFFEGLYRRQELAEERREKKRGGGLFTKSDAKLFEETISNSIKNLNWAKLLGGLAGNILKGVGSFIVGTFWRTIQIGAVLFGARELIKTIWKFYCNDLKQFFPEWVVKFAEMVESGFQSAEMILRHVWDVISKTAQNIWGALSPLRDTRFLTNTKTILEEVAALRLKLLKEGDTLSKEERKKINSQIDALNKSASASFSEAWTEIGYNFKNDNVFKEFFDIFDNAKKAFIDPIINPLWEEMMEKWKKFKEERLTPDFQDIGAKMLERIASMRDTLMDIGKLIGEGIIQNISELKEKTKLRVGIEIAKLLKNVSPSPKTSQNNPQPPIQPTPTRKIGGPLSVNTPTEIHRDETIMTVKPNMWVLPNGVQYLLNNNSSKEQITAIAAGSMEVTQASLQGSQAVAMEVANSGSGIINALAGACSLLSQISGQLGALQSGSDKIDKNQFFVSSIDASTEFARQRIVPG